MTERARKSARGARVSLHVNLRVSVRVGMHMLVSARASLRVSARVGFEQQPRTPCGVRARGDRLAAACAATTRAGSRP